MILLDGRAGELAGEGGREGGAGGMRIARERVCSSN